MGYDNCGNITSKTWLSPDIEYGEGSAGPHALTTINDPDTSYAPVPQIITYNCFNKVSSITDTLAGNIPLSVSFDYGLNNQRIKTTTARNGTVERVKYFNADYEEDSASSGLKKYHYIHGGTGLTAIFVEHGSGNDTMYYVLSDHLGSMNAIVNASTDAISRYSYNAWGVPRDGDDWTGEQTGELFAGRGFSGHEHLREFKLINMNGRIYDPVSGRFLSPDPYIQAPQYPNSYNRYSYVLNNPLKYTDPSGYRAQEPYHKWPKTYVTQSAAFGWGYQSPDPWVEPYQVNGTQGSLFYKDWTQLNGFSFGGWVPNSSLISFSTTGQAENYLKIANGGEAEYTFNVSNGYDRAYAQFSGFDQHFFDYEFSTGKFFLPEVDIEINPIKVLLGIIDWYSPTPFLDDLYKSLPPSINSTPYDPPFFADNTFEMLLIPIPPIIKALKGIKPSSKIVNTTARQLQRKFGHAKDFGVIGNYSKANSARFNSAINQHINSPGVMSIPGTYRSSPVTHYLDPNTGLNVIVNQDGTFLRVGV